MSRMSIFLVVSLAIGVVLLVARFKGHENDFGGIGRYRDRGDNTDAWRSYGNLRTPSAEDLLKGFRPVAGPDTNLHRKLLPDDNLRHVLLSLRDTSEEDRGDPVEAYAKVFEQEMGLPLRDRVDGKTTLADLLGIMNELLGPRMREQARLDSLFKLRKVARDWEKERLEGRRKDSLLYVQMARDRDAAENRKTMANRPDQSFDGFPGEFQVPESEH